MKKTTKIDLMALAESKWLTKQQHKQVSDKFKWRDRTGNFYYPKDMETRHLFFTLRMIWNHTMPLKFVPFNMYTFSDFYTNDYLAKAILNITLELVERDDLEPSWRATLAMMIEYLQTIQIAADKPKVLH